MKKVQIHIETELTKLNDCIVAFQHEMSKSDLLFSQEYWKTQIKIAEAEKNQLLTIQKMIDDESN